MTTSIGKPTLMDMFRPEWRDDPYRFYAEHRGARPLFWDEFLRTWVVLDHATISALLKDDRLSSSRVRGFHERLPEDSRNRMAPKRRATGVPKASSHTALKPRCIQLPCSNA